MSFKVGTDSKLKVMSKSFVLPLYPLDGFVLLPTLRVEIYPSSPTAQRVLQRAERHQNLVVASFFEDNSVHEIGVKARITVSEEAEGTRIFEGLRRCRLRKLLPDEVPVVFAEDFPDRSVSTHHADPLRQLLLRRFFRLSARLQRPAPSELTAMNLETLTWRLTAELNLDLSQQQGLLNVSDALTRGKILLLALRDAEQRERLLRPYTHLRQDGQWN